MTMYGVREKKTTNERMDNIYYCQNIQKNYILL
jgi:hypothetical protein